MCTDKIFPLSQLNVVFDVYCTNRGNNALRIEFNTYYYDISAFVTFVIKSSALVSLSTAPMIQSPLI